MGDASCGEGEDGRRQFCIEVFDAGVAAEDVEDGRARVAAVFVEVVTTPHFVVEVDGMGVVRNRECFAAGDVLGDFAPVDG